MTRTVKLDQLVVSSDLYVRCSYDETRVEEFAELLGESPGALPLIQVIHDPASGRYLVVDGVHRYYAWTALDADEVPVEVMSVPEGVDARRYAVLHGIAQSAMGPLTPTAADRRRFCDLLTEHCPEMSDAEVARRCGLTRQGVWTRRQRAHRRERETSGGEMPQPSPTADLVAKRLISGMARLEDARGIRDLASPSRMGRHLARALEETHGEGAASHAERYVSWWEGALNELEQSA